MKTTGTIQPLDDTRAAVRVEDVFHTDIDDLWEACTTPDRLARWIAQVSGDLRVGGTVHAVFTSTWAGPLLVEVCEAPHHLRLSSEAGTDDETQIEAWLTVEEAGTRMVVEERGLPLGQAHFYGAGWQVHLEDLGRSLAADAPVHEGGWSELEPAAAWHARWTELTPVYQGSAAG